MKATFEISGWAGTEEHIFEGTPTEIIDQFIKIQELECVCMMGRARGEDSKVINRLEKFLKKYDNGKLTKKDLEEFDFELSVGSFRCTEVQE